MFTGIIEEIGTILSIEKLPSHTRYTVRFPKKLLNDLKLGASVAIDGVCQSVVAIEGDKISFDAIPETLAKTTIADLKPGTKVHLERALKFGDEVSGHILSGHVYGTGRLFKIEKNVFFIEAPLAMMKYFFPKGYIAIDGISLTLVDVDLARGIFTVHLIPDTLSKTTLSTKLGLKVNLEIYSQTQAIVDTIERMKF